MINLLWIDDEFENNQEFIELAYEDDIQVFGYKTAASGVEEFKSNSEKYDAVVLDAMGYKDDSNEATSLSGIHYAIKELAKFEYIKNIPTFIYSGWHGETKDSSAKSSLDGYKIFGKGKDEEALINEIKSKCKNLSSYRMKQKFSKQLAICESFQSMPSTFNLLLELLVFLDSDVVYERANWNKLRIVLENSLNYLINNKVIPKELDSNRNAQLRFLQGEAVDFPFGLRPQKSFKTSSKFPDLIVNSAFYMFSLASQGSHSSNPLGTENHRNTDLPLLEEIVSAPFVQKAMIYQLLDFINFIAEENEQILNGHYGWTESNLDGGISYNVTISEFNGKGGAIALNEYQDRIFIPPHYSVELEKKYKVTGYMKNQGTYWVTSIAPL